MKRFSINTEVFFGDQVLDKLKEFQNQSVTLVTDAFMIKSGTADRIIEKLTAEQVTVFSEVVPDPPIELICKGVRVLEKARPTAVVALGGGSSIDAAKAILKVWRTTDPSVSAKLIAVPTTSGTGSEVTQFAVISDPQKGLKYPLESEDMLPDIALLDPELVRSAPDFVTADTGMDVITHALEAYVSPNASDCTDALAEKALALAFEFLPIAYRDGNDMVAREKMHVASCLAGMAFNSVGLGVNHGIAHTVGAKFHIPHGRINAMILPIAISYNAELDGDLLSPQKCTASLKYCNIAKILGLAHFNPIGGVKSLIKEIERLSRLMKIPSSLKEYGVDVKELKELEDDIVAGVLDDACTKANPRTVTDKDVRMLLKKLAGR